MLLDKINVMELIRANWNLPFWQDAKREIFLFELLKLDILKWSTTLRTTYFLSVIFCVVWGLWSVPIPRNGALRQWFIVATISGNFLLLKSLLAGTTTFMHQYGPNGTCVFNMKRTTYPYFLTDFYDASQFEMINFNNVNKEHYNSDPVISLFGNMQIIFQYMKYDVIYIN